MASRFTLVVGLAISGEAFLAQAADIGVMLDRDVIIAVPDKTATVVIGNPLIADATLFRPSHIVITGKSYGSTNLIALDRGAAVLVEHNVVVGSHHDVTGVFRGAQRETYSCTPKQCDPLLRTLGDHPEFFDSGQAASPRVSAQASGDGRRGIAGRDGSGERDGPCNKPDDVARDGSRCGDRAASERPGGRP